jgi:hypothetical protein
MITEGLIYCKDNLEWLIQNTKIIEGTSFSYSYLLSVEQNRKNYMMLVCSSPVDKNPVDFLYEIQLKKATLKVKE